MEEPKQRTRKSGMKYNVKHKGKNLVIRISDEEYNDLIAKCNGVPFSSIIRKLIHKFVKEPNEK